MSATVTLEISDYFPTGFNFEGYSFNFKSDNIDELIEWSKKNKVTATINNLKKDRKLTIRVLKNNSVVGLTELVLPELLLIKREEDFTKIISITMIDSFKKALMGKDLNKTLQIQIKAKIEYTEDFHTSGYGIRSSSAKPINSLTIDTGKKVSQIKPNYIINERGSIQVTKDPKTNNPLSPLNPLNPLTVNSYQITKPKEVDEFGEEETSFIDLFFNDEHFSDFDNADKFLNEFIEQFNNLSTSVLEEKNDTLLKNKTKELIPQLFELQKQYYTEFHKATKTNKTLKELLVKYNEKFRSIVKKTHRLREALESNNIKNELTSFVNKEENKRVKDSLNINKTELDIFRKLFKIKNNPPELKEFKEKNNNAEVTEKRTLLHVLETLCKKSNLIEKLPEDKKIKMGYLTMKYEIKCSQPEEQNLEVEEKAKELENIIDNVVLEKNVNEDSPKKKRSVIVRSNTFDAVDRKLDEILMDFYAKKKLTVIPFKKGPQGDYEYGTQKVAVKVEGDNIKVKIGGVYINLDKFLEVYAPLEEAKQIKNSLHEKFKNYSTIIKYIGQDIQPKNVSNKVASPERNKKKNK